MCIHTNSTVRQAVAKKGVWSKAIWEKDTSWPDHIINFKTHGKDRTKGTIEQVLELAPYIRSIKIIWYKSILLRSY